MSEYRKGEDEMENWQEAEKRKEADEIERAAKVKAEMSDCEKKFLVLQFSQSERVYDQNRFLAPDEIKQLGNQDLRMSDLMRNDGLPKELFLNWMYSKGWELVSFSRCLKEHNFERNETTWIFKKL